MGVSSYGANAQVFLRDPRLTSAFPDGSSHTIAFTEHYAQNCGIADFNWFVHFPNLIEQPGKAAVLLHRTTFADNGANLRWFTPNNNKAYIDAIPVTSGSPPVSTSSIPGLMFQVQPSVADCDPRIPQTPHRAMLTALFDGSVKSLTPDISPSVFWGAVTAGGGELLGDF